MTIEIHQPELEALINRRMASGSFETVEDFLLQALKSFSAQEFPVQVNGPYKQNLADFLIDSPLYGSGLITETVQDCPKPIEF